MRVKLIRIETPIGPKWEFPNLPRYWVRNFNGNCEPGTDLFQAFMDTGYTNRKILEAPSLKEMEKRLAKLIKTKQNEWK